MFSAVRGIINWNELILAFAVTNLKQRYKQRYLRAAWAVINPLMTMLIFTIVFSRVAKLPSEGVPYPLFCFTALVPWTFFSSSIGFSVNSLNSNFSLITRLNFPKITIILGSILATVSDFAISCLLLSVVFFVYGFGIGINALYIPLIFAIQLLFVLGVSLILSLLNVYLRDIQSAIPVVMQVWMLISPIGYSFSMVGDNFRPFYLLNPMSGIIDSYRRTLLHNMPPDIYNLGVAAVISVSVFLFGYWLFKKKEKYLADIISI